MPECLLSACLPACLLRSQVGDDVTKEQMREFVWATLKSGKVVPGFGHAVLRKTDPRCVAGRVLCLRGWGWGCAAMAIFGRAHELLTVGLGPILQKKRASGLCKMS